MTWEHEAFPRQRPAVYGADMDVGSFEAAVYGGDRDVGSVEAAVYGTDRDVGSVESILPVQRIFHGATSLGRGCFLPPSAV